MLPPVVRHWLPRNRLPARSSHLVGRRRSPRFPLLLLLVVLLLLLVLVLLPLPLPQQQQ